MAQVAEPDPDQALVAAGEALADAVEAALPGWVERSVGRLLEAWLGAVDEQGTASGEAAGRRAAHDVVPRLRRLLEADVDAQRMNPLALLREAVVYPTEVLREAGVPEVVRDEDDEARFPGDVYDLAPRSFADVDAALQEPGLVWGACKARASIVRHAAGGGANA
ncbi:MAG: hypothetical protein H0U89_06150 [Acidimicrobiia bacterium]|nr:hypothetical protein [Acidimicrobiia bacterium]